MGKKYRVTDRNERGPVRHEYPADPQSLAIVLAAGGRSKLTAEQAAQVKLKSVGPGDDCSDMPETTIEAFLAHDWIEEVTENSVTEAPVVEIETAEDEVQN